MYSIYIDTTPVTPFLSQCSDWSVRLFVGFETKKVGEEEEEGPG